MKLRLRAGGMLCALALVLCSCIIMRVEEESAVPAAAFTYEPVATPAPGYFDDLTGYLSEYWRALEAADREALEGSPWYGHGQRMAALDSAEVVAEVNGEAILEKELEARLLSKQFMTEENVRIARESPEYTDEMIRIAEERAVVPSRAEMLEEMILALLIQQEGARLGLVPAQEEMEEAAGRQQDDFRTAMEDTSSGMFASMMAYDAGRGVSQGELELKYLNTLYAGIVRQKLRAHINVEAGLRADDAFIESDEAFDRHMERCRANSEINVYK